MVNANTRKLGKLARMAASMIEDMDESDARILADGSEPRFVFNRNREWQKAVGFDPDAPPDSSETVVLSPSPDKPKEGKPTPRRLLESPARAATPRLERPRPETSSELKRRVFEGKERVMTPKKRSPEPQRGFLRNALGWLVGENLVEGDTPRAVVPFASPLEPPKKPKGKKPSTPQPPPETAKRTSKPPERTTYDKPGQPKGKGRWTDYSGPMPKVVRSYGSGTAGAKDSKKQRGSENDPLYFHDDDNDVCETGEMTQPDEMTHTEIREAHLDPDWKGLPKRWGQERRYKKLRKGYGMPKEKY